MELNQKDQYISEAEIFKALAHPVRLFVIHAIKEKEVSVQELADEAEIDISTMSKHLDLLKRLSLIKGNKVKNKVYYQLNIPCVLEFMQCAKRVIESNK